MLLVDEEAWLPDACSSWSSSVPTAVATGALRASSACASSAPVLVSCWGFISDDQV